jgi:hypothetical protein
MKEERKKERHNEIQKGRKKETKKKKIRLQKVGTYIKTFSAESSKKTFIRAYNWKKLHAN